MLITKKVKNPFVKLVLNINNNKESIAIFSQMSLCDQ